MAAARSSAPGAALRRRARVRSRASPSAAPHGDVPALDGAAAAAAPGAAMLDSLYRRHWDELCRRLRRVFGDGPPEPEDLAQAAFAKALAAWPPGGLVNPRAFLFRVAVNAGLDSVRRIARARAFIAEELAATAAGDGVATPHDILAAKDKLEALRAAIAALPPKQRDVLVRSRIRGESYAEIARATGWSPADISRRLAEALAALQDTLDRGR